jgi:hypothetical protein
MAVILTQQDVVDHLRTTKGTGGLQQAVLVTKSHYILTSSTSELCRHIQALAIGHYYFDVDLLDGGDVIRVELDSDVCLVYPPHPVTSDVLHLLILAIEDCLGGGSGNNGDEAAKTVV